MRVLFLGTPEFAVPSLRALAAEHNVLAAFTQPDRPKGRGKKIVESPVKQAAVALGIRVLQPERVRRSPNPELIESLAPELAVVVGYGQIIPQNIIDIPKHGIVNVHASLLPRYRGAAPIQWAIANGETRTGVTIMQIDAGLDTGDMLAAQIANIEEDETAPELSARLADIGAELLIKTIRQMEDGMAHREKQQESDATLAPILRKEDGLIDWNRTAREIYDRMRGFTPWPGAYTSFRGGQLAISRARVADGSGLVPGQLRAVKKQLFAGSGENTGLELLEVQPAGKNRMSAEAFLNGYSVGENEFFGSAK
jgi:methionyl-tRNA formyltransferase